MKQISYSIKKWTYISIKLGFLDDDDLVAEMQNFDQLFSIFKIHFPTIRNNRPSMSYLFQL